jgi:hypothetical protein
MSRSSARGRSLRAATILVALVAGPAAELSAQPGGASGDGTHIVRGGFVGFGTGDDAGCPTGSGVVGGIERRTGGRWFAGVGVDLYVATPVVCADVATIVPHDRGTVHEIAGITLLFAPRLSGRVGTAFDAGAVRVEPSLVAGAVYAPSMRGDAGRAVVPWAGAALAVQPRGWRFGFALEHGYHRVPVSHALSEDAGWRVIDEFGRWKSVVNVAVRIRR